MLQRRRGAILQRRHQNRCQDIAADCYDVRHSDVAVQNRSDATKIIAPTPDCYDLRHRSLRHHSDVVV